jgi:peptidoglycan/xylan/chitin deacetylase (PgdA/CDA1 family)
MLSRSTLRAAVLRRFDHLGVFDRVAARNRRRITVVQYHGVTTSGGPRGTSYRKKHVEVGRFEAQMRWLKERYRMIPLDDVVSHLVEGAPLPDRPAVITFDDGFRNNYTVAYPVLKSLGLPATLFVPTDFVSGKGPLWLDRIEYSLNETRRASIALDILGVDVTLRLESDRDRTASKKLVKSLLRAASPRLIEGVVGQLEAKAGVAVAGDRNSQGDYAPLTWQEAAEMSASGLVSVGSHTVSHPILPRCTASEMEHELTASKRLIEANIGRECRLFCYPNGDFDGGTQAAVGKAGYAGAACSVQGFNDERTDVLAIRRVGIPGTVPLPEFAALVSGTLFLFANMRRLALRAS